jgi:hypothetical protein
MAHRSKAFHGMPKFRNHQALTPLLVEPPKVLQNKQLTTEPVFGR